MSTFTFGPSNYRSPAPWTPATPRSSREETNSGHNFFTRMAPPAELRDNRLGNAARPNSQAAACNDNGFESSRPTGLHTPAPSLDAKVADSEALATAKVLAQIAAMGLSDVGYMQIPKVEPLIWAALNKAHAETVGYKLQFSSLTQELMIAQAAQSTLMCEWNREIRVDCGDGEYMDVTPDFAIGERGTVIPKYHLIFECGWSQSEVELAAKADDWFLLPDVIAVIVLNLEEGVDFRSPPAPLDDYVVKSMADFGGDARTPLGPVVFEGETWGQMKNISMTIHHRNAASETFDLTPITIKEATPPPGADTTTTVLEQPQDQDPSRNAAVKLEEEQNRVDVYLVQLLAGVMTPGELAKYLQAHNTLFSLDWATFYEELDRRLLAEAFARYTTWANRPGREDVGVQLRLTIQAVADPLRAAGNKRNWSFASVFGRRIETKCPSALSSRVFVALPTDAVYSINPESSAVDAGGAIFDLQQYDLPLDVSMRWAADFQHGENPRSIMLNDLLIHFKRQRPRRRFQCGILY
ncbi:hypothetical protein B0H17DRAFT_1324361 [Mycena rosella]|uniref:Uncharacterized protein n=1 Tax=Mycena rosella TaxID=1033263 RepID=A0AAD7H3K1_MYCRO|nr:hypothetical protein B0H17DRAFT_1324361 [Mycena rosella]